MTDEQKRETLGVIASTLRDLVSDSKERPTAEYLKTLAEDLGAALAAAFKKLSDAT